jgi:hypothetical protein
MYTLLDLELEDFLDPSLPRMYCRKALLEAESTPFVFTTEFTDANPEFRKTTVMPPIFPPRLENNRLVLDRVRLKKPRNSNAGGNKNKNKNNKKSF